MRLAETWGYLSWGDAMQPYSKFPVPDVSLDYNSTDFPDHDQNPGTKFESDSLQR